MKLTSLLVAGIASEIIPTDQSDCPNNGWQFLEDACQPVDVTVECLASKVVVKFDNRHIYKALDTSKFGLDESAASLSLDSDNACLPVLSDAAGNYTLEFSYDECGTVVSQADGAIVFANTIQGNGAATQVDGIYMTKTLSFDIECSFIDTVDVTSTGIQIDMDDVATEATLSAGNEWQSSFEMKAFTTSAYDLEVSETNTVKIGLPAYFEISELEDSLPAAIDYYLTDCSANSQDGELSYPILKDMCYSELLNVEFARALTSGGSAADGIKFNFNMFSFTADGEAIDVTCKIQFCAIDNNGEKIDDTCAQQRQEICDASVGYRL